MYWFVHKSAAAPAKGAATERKGNYLLKRFIKVLLGQDFLVLSKDCGRVSLT